jgi:ABC-type lipoprotein export system ATPase subunit
LISFKKVTKTFQLDTKTAILPVKDVSLDIGSGEFIIIFGRSGSGKTTLLNLAAGMIRPTSGQVVVDKNDLADMTDQQLSEIRNRKLGFVFQFPSLLSSLNVLENVTLPGIFIKQMNERAIKERGLELLETMGLSAKAGVYPRQLSAGEQKRVVLVRSMINNPEIILADEPTSDLDEQTELDVMKLLRGINEAGVTFLMVTHSLQLVCYASRAFNMENGMLSEVNGTRSKR